MASASAEGAELRARSSKLLLLFFYFCCCFCCSGSSNLLPSYISLTTLGAPRTGSCSTGGPQQLQHKGAPYTSISHQPLLNLLALQKPTASMKSCRCSCSSSTSTSSSSSSSRSDSRRCSSSSNSRCATTSSNSSSSSSRL